MIEVVIVEAIDFYIYEGASPSWIQPGEKLTLNPNTCEVEYMGKVVELYPHEYRMAS